LAKLRNLKTRQLQQETHKSKLEITGLARTGDGLQRLKMKKAGTEVDVREVASVGPPPVIRVIRELVVDVGHVVGSYK
jgi:hypothetical protein